MKTRFMVLALLIGALLAAPAMAQEKNGFRVGLAGVLGTKVGNLDAIYGAVDQCYGCTEPYTRQYDPLSFDFGSNTAWQLEFSYTVGDDSFKATYWNYDNDISQVNELIIAPTCDEFGNCYQNTPIYDFISGDDVSRIEAKSSLESHAFDLAWEHTFAKSEKAQWAFLLGLREWKLDANASTVGYDWDGTVLSALHADAGWVTSEAKGFGPIAGMSMTYTFGPKVWLDASVRAAYLQGKIDASLKQQWNYAVDVDGTLEQRSDINYYPVKDKDRGYTQFEFDARVNVNIIAGLDAFAGYQQRVFNKAVGYSFSGGEMTGLSAAAMDPSFAGWLLGAAYRF